MKEFLDIISLEPHHDPGRISKKVTVKTPKFRKFKCITETTYLVTGGK